MKTKNCHTDLPGTLKQLGALALFGHLTPSLFALACFPAVAAASRKTTAARAIALLEEGRLIRSMVNAVGTTSLVPTPRGAALWNEHHPDDVRAVAGAKDSMDGPTFMHRQIADAYLASQMHGDDVLAVVSEYAMCAGTMPLDVDRLKAVTGKLPDGLIFRARQDPQTGDWYDLVEWVEAESRHKKTFELEKILSVAEMANHGTEPYFFKKPFRRLEGNFHGWTHLTVAMQEANYAHVSRLESAVADHDGAPQTARWPQVKSWIRVAAVPLRRYSFTLDGEVGLFGLDEAGDRIASRLQVRAREEMTPKEQAKAAALEAEWIANFDAAQLGGTDLQPVEKPDFGYAVRQARSASRRPPVDRPVTAMYPPVPRRRRVPLPALSAGAAE